MVEVFQLFWLVLFCFGSFYLFFPPPKPHVSSVQLLLSVPAPRHGTGREWRPGSRALDFFPGVWRPEIDAHFSSPTSSKLNLFVGSTKCRNPLRKCQGPNACVCFQCFAEFYCWGHEATWIVGSAVDCSYDWNKLLIAFPCSYLLTNTRVKEGKQ